MRAMATCTLAVAAVSFGACSTTRIAPPTVKEASLQDELRQRTAAFSRSILEASKTGWSAEEVLRIADFYATDAVIFPPKGETMRGRAAQVSYWTRPAHRQILAHSATAERIEVSGNLATEWGTLRVTFKESDAEPVESVSNYISIWTRRDGVWQKQLDSWW